MFVTYLNTVPYSKFLLIEDNIEEPGSDILNFLIKSRLKLGNCGIHYLIFEGCFRRKVIENAQVYDFVSNLKNWKKNEEQEKLTMENVISKMSSDSVVFIDSLVHVILEYGFKNTYQILHGLINNKNILQVVTLFHSDLLEDAMYLEYFQHLSTFFVSLESKFYSNRPRLAYTYKKSGGKIVKQIEEYYFENDMLRTEPIKKLEAQQLVDISMDEIEPDKLTTFKISLEEDEKKARESVVLPYLPKDYTEEDGQIFYQFDEIDDWDEEDPDDDLNI